MREGRRKMEDGRKEKEEDNKKEDSDKKEALVLPACGAFLATSRPLPTGR
jgi:hypothetical protein